MNTDRISNHSHQSLLTLCLPVIVIAGLALTLRPTITSTGPLLDEIRVSTGIGIQAA